ncbi:MAG: signal recognition particle-docking protein FtsY [Bdellovibrionota bacterium]
MRLALFAAAVTSTGIKVANAGKIELPEELGRASNIAGRIEKLERTLNEFKTNSLRATEIQKNEIQNIAATLEAIRRKTGAEAPKKSSTDENTSESDSEDESKSLKQPTDVEVKQAEQATKVEKTPEALSKKLVKTRSGIFSRIKGLFNSKSILDEDSIEELRAILVSSDVGVATTEKLITELQTELTKGTEVNRDLAVDSLRIKLKSLLASDTNLELNKTGNEPLVVMLVGVNGVGKTTTTAKLAAQCKARGMTVMMAAADTFRAAAVAQLKEWGDRLDIPVIAGEENAKPSTVAYQAAEKAKQAGVDVLLIDTAGRLHTKANLMQELEGVRNVISKHIANAPQESILVVDGSTGQNALSQAKEFNQAVPLTGLIITKLDGTPKGGIVAAIKNELDIPVRYIGVGESAADLRVFDADAFVDALFDDDGLTLDIEQGTVLSAHAETRRRRRRDETGSVNPN